ncbi:ABC transporter substrate-binding protein [Bradyrhizobium sp. AUGA SZCCT0177]|uniref:ABC transporter substrate-binding protein n=1 Tax=Bradyrhizobium sp. AUGA SZCCT0177 TaxID=2807665 RepID=UPI001BA8560D|nr:ABC transporter substrate-binding protein [Bradyrhizobium sp. AUGA SZCCT0177]MBR1284849.1 ABC transporter substrate-binding protein [Bradyrhizobium sp. AUGA SZCCT0177]
MRRRDFMTLLVGASGVAWPFAADAQQPARIARIGYLATNLINQGLLEAFRQGLRDLGYVEGRNVVIEYRDAQGKLEPLPALAAELVALKVDVIVASSTAAAQAAKQATAVIPIVFATVPDPVATGLVTSLARPGGNVTGLSNLNADLVGKCLEYLTQAVPRVSRVAVLWQPGAFGERTEKEMLQAAAAAARALGIQLQFVEARDPADIDKAFSEITGARADALTVLVSGMLLGERRRLVDLAGRNRLPVIYTFRELVDAGGLMSYGPSLDGLFRRAASYVDKILKGTKPADLPVEQPTKLELVINLKTAHALGLTVPPTLVARADQVIE